LRIPHIKPVIETNPRGCLSRKRWGWFGDKLDVVLSFTPVEKLVDSQGRPYFLWDCDLTLDEFRSRLVETDLDVRAYFSASSCAKRNPTMFFSSSRSTIFASSGLAWFGI
jgi:hypothetical protein